MLVRVESSVSRRYYHSTPIHPVYDTTCTEKSFPLVFLRVMMKSFLMPFTKSMRTAYTLDGMKLPEVYPSDSGTLDTKNKS